MYKFREHKITLNECDESEIDFGAFKVIYYNGFIPCTKFYNTKEDAKEGFTYFMNHIKDFELEDLPF